MMKKTFALLALLYMFGAMPSSVGAAPCDTLSRWWHSLSAEFRGGRLVPTASFFSGDNASGRAMRHYAAWHLRYAFAAPSGSSDDRLYGGAYQGLGIARYRFGNRRELGDPFAAYLFQGARIVRLAPTLSLDYEWNFGLSWGWRPYRPSSNPYNYVIGSRVNAYLNASFLLSWRVASRWRLWLGLDLAHFSNGNTRLPNAGLNVVGAKLGLSCLLSTPGRLPVASGEPLPSFRRHFSYDIVFFGSWRRKLYEDYDGWHLSPKAYGVLGTGLSAMWNPARKLRAGAAFDVVYDASANEFYAHDPSASRSDVASDGFIKPPLSAKVAIGLSARLEYVMPYFTVGIGLGANVLHRGGELNTFYQLLYLKMDIARPFFLHVGYRLQEFDTPSHLMLGFGFRLNDGR